MLLLRCESAVVSRSLGWGQTALVRPLIEGARLPSGYCLGQARVELDRRALFMPDYLQCRDFLGLSDRVAWGCGPKCQIDRQKSRDHPRLLECSPGPGGETGRHKGLKIPRRVTPPCRFESGPGHRGRRSKGDGDDETMDQRASGSATLGLHPDRHTGINHALCIICVAARPSAPNRTGSR
jgi:hypothetical protein